MNPSPSLSLILMADIRPILFALVLIASILFMVRAKKHVKDGSHDDRALAGEEKILIWVLCVLNPILAGAVFYYGWKTKLPTMAKQANAISLWAFLLAVFIVFSVIFISRVFLIAI